MQHSKLDLSLLGQLDHPPPLKGFGCAFEALYWILEGDPNFETALSSVFRRRFCCTQNCGRFRTSCLQNERVMLCKLSALLGDASIQLERM